ncbi:hypothetical protein C6376_32430 [Streptomyces sp. P3]|nr:hypothetical protein C6376_32430 [Streptomyces sp. P3]
MEQVGQGGVAGGVQVWADRFVLAASWPVPAQFLGCYAASGSEAEDGECVRLIGLVGADWHRPDPRVCALEVQRR